MAFFSAEAIAGSFWNAVGVILVVNFIGGIINVFLKKVNNVLGVLVLHGVNVAIVFHIYQIRGGTGWLIWFILCVIGAIVIVLTAMFSRKLASVIKITDENIAQFADGANSKLPQKIDEMTRCEKIKTMPGKVWIYQMTILNTTGADTSALVNSLMSNDVRKNLLTNIKTNADMNVLRNSDVTICYEYSDEAGNVLHTITFVPSDYK